MPLHLTASDGSDLTDPLPGIVQDCVRQALLANGYAILEAEPERYVQAGSGRSVGRKQAAYAVEHRDGSEEAHFRYETDDLLEVLSVFEAFAQGDDGYRTVVPWQPYRF